MWTSQLVTSQCLIRKLNIALQNMLQLLVGKKCIKVKQLASLDGKIISMNLALGPAQADD